MEGFIIVTWISCKNCNHSVKRKYKKDSKYYADCINVLKRGKELTYNEYTMPRKCKVSKNKVRKK